MRWNISGRSEERTPIPSRSMSAFGRGQSFKCHHKVFSFKKACRLDLWVTVQLSRVSHLMGKPDGTGKAWKNHRYLSKKSRRTSCCKNGKTDTTNSQIVIKTFSKRRAPTYQTRGVFESYWTSGHLVPGKHDVMWVPQRDSIAWSPTKQGLAWSAVGLGAGTEPAKSGK